MNTQVLMKHFKLMVDTLLMSPPEPWMFWVNASVGFLVLAWVFTRVGEQLSVSNVEGFAGFVASVIGTGFMLAGITAARIYLAPELKVEPNLAFTLVMAAICSAVISAPVIKFWTQAKFFNIIVAWFLALVAGMAIVFAFSYGFGSFNSGRQQFQNSEHRKALNESLNGK